MKGALVIYWLIGCMMVGCAMGWHENRCPNDAELSGINAAGMVAVWPVAIFYVIAANDRSQRPCKPVSSNNRTSREG